MNNHWSEDNLEEFPDWGATAAAKEEEEEDKEDEDDDEEEPRMPHWNGATEATHHHHHHDGATVEDARRVKLEEDNDNDDDDDHDHDAFSSAPDEPAAPAAPEPVASSSHHHHQHRDSSHTTTTTNSGIDGMGLWKSWTHNYEQASFACLDLLDNGFDATLPPSNSNNTTSNSSSSSNSNFQGTITMEYLSPNGMVITNNSAKPIQSLEETLTAYRSDKNNATGEAQLANNLNKQAIGEYGVGLKQACATLSDTSLVLTRNHNVVQLGVIAKDLQSRDNVSLPHFTFAVDTTNAKPIQEQLHHHMSHILKEHPTIGHLITTALGAEHPQQALERLVDQCHHCLWNETWKNHNDDHVFSLILTHIKHTESRAARTASTGIRQHPARGFLRDIRTLLPKHYSNVPLQGFSFTIDGQPVNFSYWQNRLVEMTKFQVFINKEKPVHTMSDDSDWAHNGYPLSLYCGFDALRLQDKDKTQAKTCQLCIYSRQSGRLIEVTQDARDMLGMASSGVDFSEGLTVIVDDVGGELPLKPTKDGLTWSKEASGEIHKSNLFAWIGAVGYLYWKYHAQKFECFQDVKKMLAEAVLSFVEPIEKRIQEQEDMTQQNNTMPSEEDPSQDIIMERLEQAKFTMFSDVTWRKAVNRNSKKVTIRKKMKLDAWPGPATVFRFQEDRSQYADAEAPVAKASKAKPKRGSRKPVGRPRAAKKKRVSSFGLRGAAPWEQPSSSSSGSGSEEEEVITSQVAVRKSPRKVVARKRNGTTATSTSATNNGADGIMTVENIDDEAPATSNAGEHDRAKTKDLEQALQSSQEHVRKLQAELLEAKSQLLKQADPLHDYSVTFQPSQSHQATMQENALLRQQKNQLAWKLQKAEDQRKYEAATAKLKIERLELELQQRETAIQSQQQQPQQQGGNGSYWGGPDLGFGWA